MKLSIKKNTHAYIGSMPITFLEDTEVDIQANSLDEIAEMMASRGGQRVFGEHLESLKRDETVTRNINGVPHEVEVAVSYGAGGARMETDKGAPRKIGAPSGGIGVETDPNATGNKTDGKLRMAVASGDGQDVETERLRSQPRTEFVVPPRRFPDEVQTATDPPRTELVGDSPERETPYVGEFTQSGAFSRQPSRDRGGPFTDDRNIAITDRVATEGRPFGTPDTPGTRDRVFPAPSETAKSLPDQTAVALNVADKGSNQTATVGATSDDPGKTGVTSDPDKSDKLPEDFPHLVELKNNKVTKYSQLEGKTEEELSGPDYAGIGQAKAADIVAALKKRK